ncbi:hypothetical protein Tco_0493120 [Tanacetum coccineum]
MHITSNVHKSLMYKMYVALTVILILIITSLEVGFCSGGSGGGSVDVVSVVFVMLEGTSADAVRALKIWFLVLLSL